MLWAPVKLIRLIFPSFLPYNVMLSSDAPVSELSLELLLLQVVLPALLEQGHTRTWLKGVIRGWCVAVAWALDLRSYLLGDVPLTPVSLSPVNLLIISMKVDWYIRMQKFFTTCNYDML